VSTFAIVFILPEDIYITSGSPKYHRNFFDIYLSQFDRGYLSDLMEYQKVIKQRNALLKDLKDSQRTPENVPELDAWDMSLLQPAMLIMAARQKFTGEIKANVKNLIAGASGSNERVEISYRPKIALKDFHDFREAAALLRKERKRELTHGFTVIGPHRDTFEISIGKTSLRKYGSMGQKKTAMIAMKLAALQALSAHRGEPAILVLDEAFAELDPDRANWLLGLLSGFGQVFLASANMSGLNMTGEMKIYDVAQGKVKERRS
jgi:DNA replication and repair protein RecF